MWYAAHIIMCVKYKDRIQDKYPVYENIVLIESDSEDDAWEKAEQMGRADEAGDDSFRWDGNPARLEFAGVRKLMECRSTHDLEDKPATGTEVSYSQMVVGRDCLERFLEGEPVEVLYEE